MTSTTVSIESILAQEDREKRGPTVLRVGTRVLVHALDPLAIVRRAQYRKTLKELDATEELDQQNVDSRLRIDMRAYAAGVTCLAAGFLHPYILAVGAGFYIARAIEVLDWEMYNYDLLKSVCWGEPQ